MRENGALYVFLKRIISTYVSLVMTCVSVITAFVIPIQVHAETLSDNPPDGVVDYIGQDDTMENNWGLVKNNEGTIVNNMGTAGEIAVEGNPGGDGGTITNNYGTANNATVSNNYGNAIGSSTVSDNWASGSVGAGGTVTTNHHGTDDEHKNDGLIDGVTVAEYAEWNSGPNPVPPAYSAPVSGAEDEPVSQSSEENDSLSSGQGTTEQGFVDTINYAITNSESESSIIIDMGDTSYFSVNMVQAICNASEKGLTVSMNMRVNGRNCRFVVPGNAYLGLMEMYFITMDSSCEGYAFLFNLIPGATLTYTDELGNNIMITNPVTETDIQNAISKVKNELNTPSSVMNMDGATYLSVPAIPQSPSLSAIPGILGADTSEPEVGSTRSQELRRQELMDMYDKMSDSISKKERTSEKQEHANLVKSMGSVDLSEYDDLYIEWYWLLTISVLGERGVKMYEASVAKYGTSRVI